MDSKEVRSLTILIHPRIHITLLSLTSDSYRKNGGLGFSIDDPLIEVAIKESAQSEVIDCRRIPLPVAELSDLAELARKVVNDERYSKSGLFEIRGVEFLSHIGLGAGTAIRLAIVEGLSLLNDDPKPREELIIQSGRGGTSGVGISAYFNGGYSFDLGRPSGSDPFKSSDEISGQFPLPLSLASLRMPSWQLGLCLPKLPAPSLEAERLLFRQNCPLPLVSSSLATFHSLFGVHASILESDYARFCDAVNAIQGTQWKQAEWEVHDSTLLEIRNVLMQNGADCVGLSSLGPALYFFANDVNKVIDKSELSAGHLGGFRKVHVRNEGRQIRNG